MHIRVANNAASIHNLEQQEWDTSRIGSTTSSTRAAAGAVSSTADGNHDNDNNDNNNNVDFPSFERDELCGGCRWIIAPRKRTCGKMIFKNMLLNAKDVKNSTKTNVTALLNYTQILQQVLGPAMQEICNAPCLECEDHHREYWRPDRAAPVVRQAATHYLQSIPEDHRVPRDQLRLEEADLQAYFSKPGNAHPDKQYLFEYNPSLVQLPSSYKGLQIKGENVAYIASYRVATQQSCFAPDTTLAMIGGSWLKKDKPDSISYLGIGLLSHDLTLLADVVVDLPDEYGKREDFRLFVLHDQLYLTSKCRLAPIHVGTHTPTKQKDYAAFLLKDKKNKDTVTVMDNLFESPLVVSIMLKKGVDCTADGVTGKRAKNLNYFVDLYTNQTMVELNPAGNHLSQPGPHQVMPIDLTKKTSANPKFGKDQVYGAKDVIVDDSVPDHPGFYTMDELEFARSLDFWVSPYVGDRGSACCVEFEHVLPTTNNNGKGKDKPEKLWLGISHTKIPYGRPKFDEAGLTPNQYLSRFYAFQAKAPYKTVAFSGYICLTQHDQAALHYDNPLAQRPHHSPFRVGNLTLECPEIHFIVGMTEKAKDPTKLILSYGLSDCTSWFIEVDKQEVVELLFAPPSKDVHA